MSKKIAEKRENNPIPFVGLDDYKKLLARETGGETKEEKTAEKAAPTAKKKSSAAAHVAIVIAALAIIVSILCAYLIEQKSLYIIGFCTMIRGTDAIQACFDLFGSAAISWTDVGTWTVLCFLLFAFAETLALFTGVLSRKKEPCGLLQAECVIASVALVAALILDLADGFAPALGSSVLVIPNASALVCACAVKK